MLAKKVSENRHAPEDEITRKYYSEIKTVLSNPEDKNCCLVSDQNKLAELYSKAEQILSPEYNVVSQGLFVRKNKGVHEVKAQKIRESAQELFA